MEEMDYKKSTERELLNGLFGGRKQTNVRKIKLNHKELGEEFDLDTEKCKQVWGEDKYQKKFSQPDSEKLIDNKEPKKVGLYKFDNDENVDMLCDQIIKDKPIIRHEKMLSSGLTVTFWDLSLPLPDETELVDMYTDQSADCTVLRLRITPLRHDTYLPLLINSYNLGKVYLLNNNKGLKQEKTLELLSEDARVRGIYYTNNVGTLSYDLEIEI